MKQNGVWNIPTFVVVERIAASSEQKKEWTTTHPQMRTVSQATLSFWTPENDFRLQGLTDQQLAARRRSVDLHAPIVKALHDAGAELMLGTDTPNPFVFPGFSVHEELQRFVEAGLTPWQTLRLATVQPARFLDQVDTFGRIEVGLEADLLLLDADPLADISNTQKIFGVMTRGRWLDRSALDGKLNAVAKAYGKP
jgi:imidazolonepropionase-like amidohydrolase